MKSVATLNPKRYTKATLVKLHAKWAWETVRKRYKGRVQRALMWRSLRMQLQSFCRSWRLYPWRKPSPEELAITTTYWPRTYK